MWRAVSACVRTRQFVQPLRRMSVAGHEIALWKECSIDRGLVNEVGTGPYVHDNHQQLSY